MSIDQIRGLTGQIPGISERPKVEQTTQGPKEKSFGEVFTKALGEVDSLQKEANQSIEDLTLSKNGVTTHDAMIAIEKADVAFQLMNQVRSKIVRAYEEILRTQV